MTETNLNQLKTKLKDCFVVADSNLKSHYAKYLSDDCFYIDISENAKNFITVEKIASEMLNRGINRKGTLAAVGGGCLGDIAGFTASIYMRGISWLNVPTTLLAFADSAAGGKTAINFNSTKNILGAFHKPKEILYCYEFLKTLPDKERKNGMAEIIKMSLLSQNLFDLVNSGASDIELIRASVALKSRITESDFFDNGERQKLNMGHTVGHALETVYGLSHGEAVACGLVLEAEIAGKTDKDLLEWIKRQARQLYCHSEQSNTCHSEKIANAAFNDKKNEKGITLIVPVKIGVCEKVVLSKDEFLDRLKRIAK
jgi:3-dehydroquinate synthase